MTTTNGTTSLRAGAGEPEARPDAPWAPVPFDVIKLGRGPVSTLARLRSFARTGPRGGTAATFKSWKRAADLIGVHRATLARHLEALRAAGAIVLTGRTLGFTKAMFVKLPLGLLEAPWRALVAWVELWRVMSWERPEWAFSGISALYRRAGKGNRRHGEEAVHWLVANGWAELELGFKSTTIRLLLAGPAQEVSQPGCTICRTPGASTPSLFPDLHSQQLLEPRKEEPEEPAKRPKGRQGDPDVIAVWKAFVQAGTEAGQKVPSRLTKIDANTIWGALIRYGRPQCLEAVRGVWRLNFVIEHHGGRAEVRWAFKRCDPKSGRRILGWSLERVRECVRLLNPERRYPKLPADARHGVDGVQVAIGAHLYEPSDDDAEPMIVVETKAPRPAATIPAALFGRAVQMLNRTAEIREAQDFGRKLLTRSETLELLRVATRLS